MKRRKRSLRKAINARTDYEKKKNVVEKGHQRPNLISKE